MKVQYLSLHDILSFGKYKDATIDSVIKDDPDYIIWACDNIKWFNLDDVASKVLDFSLFDNDGEDTYNNPASPYFYNDR